MFIQDCNIPQGLQINYLSIITPDQFFCWYQQVLVSEFFGSADIANDDNRLFLLRYNQIGGIRYKQSRVKPNSCEALDYTTNSINKSIPCYAEYSSSTKSVNSYGPYLNQSYQCSGLECSYMQAFQYSNNPPDASATTSDLNSYDSSGFFIDTESILVNNTLTLNALQGLGQFLQNYL